MCKSCFLCVCKSESIRRFRNTNQRNKIIMNVKGKWIESDILIFRHFWIIQNQRADSQKYASFEGVENAVTPLSYRHLGIKKALTKSAISRNSRA